MLAGSPVHIRGKLPALPLALPCPPISADPRPLAILPVKNAAGRAKNEAFLLVGVAFAVDLALTLGLDGTVFSWSPQLCSVSILVVALTL